MTDIILPQPVQRQRTAGWKMPPNTVYVGRPTKWGNPFPVGCEVQGGFPQPDGSPPMWECVMTRERSCELYRFWLLEQIVSGKLDLRELRGKNLACWCPLEQDGLLVPCHRLILLQLANVILPPEPPERKTA